MPYFNKAAFAAKPMIWIYEIHWAYLNQKKDIFYTFNIVHGFWEDPIQRFYK